MVKITLLNCIIMSLFISAMTTYVFDDIVYLELVGSCSFVWFFMRGHKYYHWHICL